MSSLSIVGPFSCLLLLLGLSVAWSVMDICSRCDLDNHRKKLRSVIAVYDFHLRYVFMEIPLTWGVGLEITGNGRDLG